jgi:hypothetical protein
VLVVRFVAGVSLADLLRFMDVVTLPVDTIFDREGLAQLLVDAGVTRIQIEEIEHDISVEDREAQARRRNLRSLFEEILKRLLAERALGVDIGRNVLELLDHPEVAVVVLEDDPLGVCDAVAALCLMVRDEQAQTGADLFPKLRAILLALSPAADERVLLGFPSLVGHFRDALAWAIRELPPDDVALIAFPSFCRRAEELDVVFYALAALLPHEGTRRSALRRVGLHLYDLGADDAVAGELLAALARTPDEFDSFSWDRECLAPHAVAALARRDRARGSIRPSSIPAAAPLDERRVIAEVVMMSGRTRRFDRLCAKLPAAAAAFAGHDSTAAVLGAMDGLQAVVREDWRELAGRTLRELSTNTIVAKLIPDVEREGAEVEGVVATLRLLVGVRPDAMLEYLNICQHRKIRRMLLEELPRAGASLLPLLRANLHHPNWFVVRNAVILLARVGGTVADLAPIAGHPNEKVRLEIARLLRTLPADSTSADIAAKYFGDAAPEVRIQARGLVRGELLGPTGIQALERIASDESQSDDDRRAATTLLGRCPADAAAVALFGLLQPKGLIDRGSARDYAAVALRASPAPTAAALFDEGLKSPAWRVRKACERAAGGS